MSALIQKLPKCCGAAIVRYVCLLGPVRLDCPLSTKSGPTHRSELHFYSTIYSARATKLTMPTDSPRSPDILMQIISSS
jgi:hypothetical protein